MQGAKRRDDVLAAEVIDHRFDCADQKTGSIPVGFHAENRRAISVRTDRVEELSAPRTFADGTHDQRNQKQAVVVASQESAGSATFVAFGSKATRTSAGGRSRAALHPDSTSRCRIAAKEVHSAWFALAQFVLVDGIAIRAVCGFAGNSPELRATSVVAYAVS